MSGPSSKQVYSIVELKNLPYIECPSRMLSVENFVFRLRLYDMSLVISPSALHGLGLFTTREVKSGEEIFLIEIRTQCLTSSEMLNTILGRCVSCFTK